MDGTILNTLADLAHATQLTLAKHQLTDTTLAEVRCDVGNGARVLFERLCKTRGCFSDELVDTLLHDFRIYYEAHHNDNTKPYEGVPDMLAQCIKDGWKLAVLSNKPHDDVCALADVHFSGLFTMAEGASDAFLLKPHPEHVEHIIHMLHATPQTCVYIGDSEVDVQTAHNAQVHGVFVDWGYRSREELKRAGATKIASTPDELYQFITHI